MNETHPSIEHIVDYLHGELSPAEDAAIYAHLASCPECDGKRNEEVAITEALRAYAHATERDMPPGLAPRIRSVAMQAQPAVWQRFVTGFRPVVMVPVAAALAVAIYIGYDSWHHAAAPTSIQAASYVNNHAAMAASAPFGDAAPPLTLTSDDATR
jgi:anti-sigma factor RsiW